MSTMCMFSAKSSKFYFKNIHSELINCTRKRNGEITFSTNCRLFFGRFQFDSSSEILPLKHSLQIVRRNHYRPRSQRYVFKPVNKSKEKGLVHASLIESLQKCQSVTEQIQVFYSVVKLSDEDINCRYSVCQSLERILQSYFPFCFLRLIGSSVNGFGIKGCDVDLSIQFQNESINEQSFRENSWLKDDLEAGDVKVFSPKSKLHTIRKILLSENYDEPLTVIPGRCPILNFTVENLECDLAVNNRSALHSTNLMLLCANLDNRVQPIMEIIIYWAKCWRLVGGPVRFKTYAVFLMVLYYLQTRNPPILPSVKVMLEKTDFLSNLDNWSYDVLAYLKLFEKSNNSQSVEELLREFFYFYRSYDFSQIICPINISSMDKKAFNEKVNTSKIFEFNTVNIQDPLDPAWNVTTGVNFKHCKSFQKGILSVSGKYEDQSCWTPGSQNWGLVSLFHKTTE